MTRKRRRVWRPRKVTVDWIDACVRVEVHGTLSAVLEKAKLSLRQSQGWLLRYDQYLTVIARDYDPPDEPGVEPEVGDVQIMPSGWVIAVRSSGRVIQREQADASPSSPVSGQDATGEGATRAGAADAGDAARPPGGSSLRASGAGLAELGDGASATRNAGEQDRDRADNPERVA